MARLARYAAPHNVYSVHASRRITGQWVSFFWNSPGVSEGGSPLPGRPEGAHRGSGSVSVCATVLGRWAADLTRDIPLARES